MQYHCPTGLLYAVTGANNGTDAFIQPYSLFTIDPATGVATRMCTVVDTSLYTQVIAFLDGNTLAHFTGTVEPTLATASLANLVDAVGDCAFNTIAGYTQNMAPVTNFSAVFAAVTQGDGVHLTAIVGRKVVSVDTVQGTVNWIANLTDQVAGFHPYDHITSVAFTGEASCAPTGQLFNVSAPAAVIGILTDVSTPLSVYHVDAAVSNVATGPSIVTSNTGAAAGTGSAPAADANANANSDSATTANTAAAASSSSSQLIVVVAAAAVGSVMLAAVAAVVILRAGRRRAASPVQTVVVESGSAPRLAAAPSSAKPAAKPAPSTIVDGPYAVNSSAVQRPRRGRPDVPAVDASNTVDVNLDAAATTPATSPKSGRVSDSESGPKRSRSKARRATTSKGLKSSRLAKGAPSDDSAASPAATL